MPPQKAAAKVPVQGEVLRNDMRRRVGNLRMVTHRSNKSGSFHVAMNQGGVDKIAKANGQWEDAKRGCDHGLWFMGEVSDGGKHQEEPNASADE